MEEQIINGVLLITALLSISVFSSMLLKKIHFPYTIGLVVVGVVLGGLSYNYASFEMFQSPSLSPGIILYIILPILIFEAAMNIDFSVLRRNLVPILLLAVFGLLISAFIIGLGLSMVTTLSFMGALVFGALISATDPVAVIALFNEIGAPKRLVTLIDGESIFNDATAIVLFNIVIVMATVSGTHVDLLKSGVDFMVILLGGVVVGGVIGAIGSFVNNFGKDNLLRQTTVSVIMAYLSFIVADHFCHFSGVMSTLAAGLVMRAGAEKTIKRSNIVTLEHFWEYFSFIANSIVFLLLGLTEYHIFRSSENISGLIRMILCVIPIVLIARFVGIYTLIPLYNRINIKDTMKKIPAGYQAVLFWGGLRGAVPVALVLAIPPDFAHRTLIIQFTFAFIMFTLLFQGTTIKWLMDKLKIRPEANEFGDRVVENHEFDFKNPRLALLVTQALRDMFDDEAYFIRDKSTADGASYLVQRGKVMLLIKQDHGKIVLTTEHENVSYFKRVLFETLLDLNEAVTAIKDVADPAKMSDLVTDTNGDDTKIQFNIMRFLTKERMITGITSKKKDDVIFELVSHLVKTGDIDKKDFPEVLNCVIEREKSMTTGLGDGIAMPHARKCEFIKNITVLVATAPEGIEFESIDGKPVNIFVMLLSPVDAVAPHVQLLASIGKLLHDPKNREKLIASHTPEELYSNIEMLVKNSK